MSFICQAADTGRGADERVLYLTINLPHRDASQMLTESWVAELLRKHADRECEAVMCSRNTVSLELYTVSLHSVVTQCRYTVS